MNEKKQPYDVTQSAAQQAGDDPAQLRHIIAEVEAENVTLKGELARLKASFEGLAKVQRVDANTIRQIQAALDALYAFEEAMGMQKSADPQ